jgi:hypothetical protein
VAKKISGEDLNRFKPQRIKIIEIIASKLGKPLARLGCRQPGKNYLNA